MCYQFLIIDGIQQIGAHLFFHNYYKSFFHNEHGIQNGNIEGKANLFPHQVESNPLNYVKANIVL